MYYKAIQKALNNNLKFHMAAILKRNGMPIKVGENTNKTHPRFIRQYSDGSWGAHMHAEMNVLRFARPGDVVEVLRVKKISKDLTMAKPCPLCQEAMKEAGIKFVRYTNWEGEWEIMELQ